MAKLFNAKSKSKTFGEVELRYISSGDVKFFVELLDKVKDNKEFVIQVLYHQLITPKVSFTAFNKIPDDELIKLAGDFAGHGQHTFKYFKKTTDVEFFTNFREAIRKYYQRQVEQLQTTFESMVRSSKKIFENYNKQFKPIPFLESIREISKVAEQYYADIIKQPVRKARLRLPESFQSVIKQYELTSRIFSEVFTPQISLWQKWAEQNKRALDIYKKFWPTFEESNIAKQEAGQILKKYKWLLSLHLPSSFIFKVAKIGRKKGNQRRAMNRLFVDYFSSGDFTNLSTLVDRWEKIAIFKPRMKIFRDCVSALINAKGNSNPSNFVLPTLIAQIDGIQTEFMKQNGLSFDPKARKWKDKKGIPINQKAWFKSQTSNQRWLDLANDIFLNILFQKSLPGEPLETPFTFNRHKIMHGEYLKYGRIDNTIRAFLILDFLAALSDKKLTVRNRPPFAVKSGTDRSE